ncbi:16S rRNA (cytosine(967)-C(5))-methyltransferase RsmB [Lactobacillus kefiranofaciens]|uniref:16S rRNA (cytosine(967)-C(5))-methyltransferase n=1 Tax=Lactobacillus kefiranofaciens TaxID=267818 RepID=A0AAX3UGF2_9LACO|nr:16S rRNA (cytosine(967)-C(5))-methyltransferase RsmB [Lactobacillus kefiranofaciens]QFQ67669.1 16S rRNA (cytosine(967)-C(5))-methyltransferase RsmB [Lactobacillus kefiranofaciens subsp. kefiranofaciens]WGO86575.1 16S rRNA (cytosine(967)-C(5))-methyltransferase RsmB [Lactobacillus kefiranofaciens]WQH36105.1 16S rRNA (cytosine(967)-C(5))-methyltransferase RsmB [Lactobacillus kefiranofaciens]
MVRAANLNQEKKLSINKSARAISLETLIRVLADGSYSNISLNNSLQHSSLSLTDQNLATRIVYGTIQYRLFLEYQLKGLVRTKITEKYLKPLLLMSLYQIIFLDKVPNRAVLDEANKLAKQFGRHHSSGYRIINGILRSFIRRGVILPDKKDRIRYLSIKESVPEWLVNYFINNFGIKKTESVLTSINQPAKNSVRISSLVDSKQVFAKLKADGYEPQWSNLSTHDVVLNHGGISQSDLFKQGKLTIQDEAASLVVEAFNFDQEADHVLDACSAPGGKTVQIAENIKGDVIALDIHEKKLNLVRENARRMHVEDRVKTKACDARKAPEIFKPGEFSKILVDAPCSGLGLLRRKPEIRYTKSLQDLRNLQKIQLAILNSVSSLLKEQGELVYSTCSISIEENEQVVKQFLRQHPSYKLEPFKLSKLESETGMLKVMPDLDGNDGFFIAKFKLRG